MKNMTLVAFGRGHEQYYLKKLTQNGMSRFSVVVVDVAPHTLKFFGSWVHVRVKYLRHGRVFNTINHSMAYLKKYLTQGKRGNFVSGYGDIDFSWKGEIKYSNPLDKG